MRPTKSSSWFGPFATGTARASDHNALLDPEGLEEHELARIRARSVRLAEAAREAFDRGEDDTGVGAVP